MAKLEKIFQEALQYQRAGKLETAVEVYKQFLSVVPDQPDAINNMGVCLIELDRSNEAIKILSDAVDIYSRDHELLNNLGNALQKSKRIEDAVARFHSALDLQPDNITILLNLSRNLLRLGEYDRALSYLEKARDLSPENANVAMVDTLALPVVYNSAEEIVTARERLTSKLAEMENQTWKIVDPATTVGQTNFFLAYQGANDKDIQSRVAALYLKSCPDLAFVADHCRPYKRGVGRRIKLGFVSAFLGKHTIGKLFQGLINGLDRNQFEIIVFHLGPDRRLEDKYLASLSDHVDHFLCVPSQYLQARMTISEMEPDIIYYTDIGMEPVSYFLAFNRLAPVQCACWGHPVTTGIPNVDYFISWKIHEPKAASQHYSEELILFSGFCTNYHPPSFASSIKGREAFGFNPDVNLYVCPQSLFKFHPMFDDMLVDILRQDKKAEIILLDGQQSNWGRLLKNRFSRSSVELTKRLSILPRLSSNDYFHLIKLADVILDTPVFCGGNTSFEALAAGKVVVTLPGQYMRGLFTSGIYIQLGLEDLIPNTPAGYVELAVLLATNAKERIKQEKRIKARWTLIFNNKETVFSHEEFFSEALAAAETKI